MPPTCNVERRDGTGACRIIGHWPFLVSAIASAAGNKTVDACTGRGCGPGQACSAQDFATTNRHHSPLRQYARKGMSPNVIHCSMNCAESITMNTLVIDVARQRGDPADAHESPLRAVIRTYRPAARTGPRRT
jgi:hypothetical protein